MTTEANNKRIAKNTLLLYFRMIILMGVSLYTSRIVLQTLGVNDFGLYNVVGGIVAVLSFLNTSMAGATQRFLNIELGKKDTEGVKSVFATAQFIHLLIAIIIFLLAETVGVWFINNQMVIAEERLAAANYVFQFSICSFLLTVISVPYNATIIAHEKMSAFAYISVFEAFLKLAIVYLLFISPFDKLIVYASLTAMLSVTVRIIYGVYCKRNFEECKRFSLRYDKDRLKQMLGFSGWTVVGALGSISHTQGIAIIINIFFGVAVNAAQGLANQVDSVINQFVINFMTALNPQIVKSYAVKNFKDMHLLIKRGSKLGFFLVSLFAIPLLLEAPTLLGLWLKEVPDYTVTFIRIIVLTSLCNSFASPLAAAQGATGKIKTYQITLTTLGWLHLPLAWLFFYLGFEPQYAMYIYLVLTIIMQMYRIYKVCKSIEMNQISYYKDVIIRCLSVFSIALIIPFLIHSYTADSLIKSLLVCIISAVITITTIYLIGLNSDERVQIAMEVKKKIKMK